MLLLENEPHINTAVVQILCEIFLFNNGHHIDAKQYEDLDKKVYMEMSSVELVESVVNILGEDKRQDLITFIGDFCTRYRKEDIIWKYIATQKIAKAMEHRLNTYMRKVLRMNRGITNAELKRVQDLFIEFKRREKGGFRFEGSIINFVMGPCYDFFTRKKSGDINAILTEKADLVTTTEEPEFVYSLINAEDENISKKVSKQLGEKSENYDIPKFKEYVNRITRASFILYKDVKKTNKLISNFDLFTAYKFDLLKTKCRSLESLMKKAGIKQPNRKYLDVKIPKSDFYIRKITEADSIIDAINKYMSRGVALEEIYNRVQLDLNNLLDNPTKEESQTLFLEVYGGLQALRDFVACLIKEGWDPMEIPSDIFQNKMWATRVRTFEDYIKSYNNLKTLDYFDISYDDKEKRTTVSFKLEDETPHNATVTKQILTRFQTAIRNKQFADMAKYMKPVDITGDNPSAFLGVKKLELESSITNLRNVLSDYGVMTYYCNFFELYVSLFEDIKLNETPLSRWVSAQANRLETANSLFTRLVRNEKDSNYALLNLLGCTGTYAYVQPEYVEAYINGGNCSNISNLYNMLVTTGVKSYGGVLSLLSWGKPEGSLEEFLNRFDNKVYSVSMTNDIVLLKNSKEDIIDGIKSGLFNNQIENVVNAYIGQAMVYPTQQLTDALVGDFLNDIATTLQEFLKPQVGDSLTFEDYLYSSLGFIKILADERGLFKSFEYGKQIGIFVSNCVGKSVQELTMQDYLTFVRFVSTDAYVYDTIYNIYESVSFKRGTMLGLMDLMDKHRNLLSIDIDNITMSEFCALQGETSIVDCVPRGERNTSVTIAMDSILRSSLSTKVSYLEFLKQLSLSCVNTKRKFSITKIDAFGVHRVKLLEYANQIRLMPNLTKGDKNLVNMMLTCTFYENEYCIQNGIIKSAERDGKTYYLHKNGYWVTAEDDAEPILAYMEIS